MHIESEQASLWTTVNLEPTAVLLVIKIFSITLTYWVSYYLLK